MKKLISDSLARLRFFIEKDISQIIFLFFITLASHGLFIPWLGLYGDDWGFLWLSYQARRPELLITESRFLLPQLYSLVAQILPPIPVYWHAFFFLIFFFNVLFLWLLLKHIWPDQRKLRLWISLLYALYPGALTSLQPVTFWWIYFQFNLLYGSFILMLKSVLAGRKRVTLIIFSLLLMVGALMFSEYIFFMELVRLPIIFLFIKYHDEKMDKPLSRSFRIYLPYLLTYAFLVIIRIFNQRELSSYYQVDADQFITKPLETIRYFISRFFIDTGKNGLAAWVKPLFDPQMYVNSGFNSLLIFISVAVIVLLGILLVSIAMHHEDHDRKKSLYLIRLGIWAVVLANLPFWLGNLEIDVGVGIFSRFSIPAVLGSAMLMVGLLTYLFKNPLIASAFFSILCGLGMLMHLLTGNLFRKEWEFQNRLYWEMAWRMPGITPGTTFISNVTPLWMVSENTLSAATNWIYMDEEPPIPYIDYYLYYDMQKFANEIPEEPDQEFTLGHYSGIHKGNSSNIIVINHQPPACFMVVNDRWDQYNPDIPVHLREAAVKYAGDLIDPYGKAEDSLKQNPIFQDENRSNICFYFHKASLAAEQEDWLAVLDLWNEAHSKGLSPKFASEYIPFIQAFAHLGQYDQAFQLSQDVIDFFKYYRPMVCDFWSEMMKEGQLDNDLILNFANQNLLCELDLK